MKIRQKLMVPLCLCLFFLMGVFIWNDSQRRTAEGKASLDKTASVIEKLIASELRADIGIMETALGEITKDPEILKFLAEQNRKKLIEQATPTFERLRKNSLITHFYFHRLDRTNLLRLHEPNHFDDLIERNTLKTAETSGEPSFGVEQGPTGASVLRVVFPIVKDGKHIGYIELGKEFQDIVTKIEKIVDTPALVLTEKSQVKQEQWVKRNNKSSFKVSWEFMENQVVMASSLTELPEELRHLPLQAQAENAYVIEKFEIVSKDKVENVIVVPFRNSVGKKLADIILLYDSSTARKAFARTAFLTIGVACIIVFSMLVFFYAFMGRVENVIAKQQQQIVSSSKMASLGEMAGGVAHEINNPLAVIKSVSGQLQEVLDDEVIDKALVKQMAGQIEKTTDRIGKIVAGLRSFSRDGSSEAFRATNIKNLISETLAFCNERFKKLGTQVTVESFPDSLSFDVRATEISQVLLNILNNANDAIATSNEKWIKVQVSEENKWIEIRVTDSGPGIPRNIQQKIFQPFFTTKEIGKGTGIGLSISLGIIRNHGGELIFDAQTKNTCFVIRLPKQHSQSSTQAAA